VRDRSGAQDTGSPVPGVGRAVSRDQEPALRRLRDLSASDDPWATLGSRALRRTGTSAAGRWQRLRSRSWQIAQCAVAAALSWLVATELVGHERPFFAPVAAVIALGISYGDRVRRVLEVVTGVAVGVAVGDLFVGLVGTGWWQIALVVATAMVLAVLLDAGLLIVTQAGVQAVIVTTLLPDPDAGLGRWVDALVGGLVALLIAALVPRSPLVRPRRLAASALGEVGELLAEAARSAEDGDLQRATRALERARASQPALDALRGAAAEGLDVVRASPFRRRHRSDLEELAGLVEPLDRAVRNVRVLLRRVTVAAWRHEPVPRDLVALISDLATATTVLAEDLAGDRDDGHAREPLRDVGRASSRVPVGVSLSGDVVLAQLRSVVVDLLQVAGLPYDEALAAVPAPRRGPAPDLVADDPEGPGAR
jgi:uncharacterized membrane protein YgaE (UPF0421/DUF939 family)